MVGVPGVKESLQLNMRNPKPGSKNPGFFLRFSLRKARKGIWTTGEAG
jgi:hypothetical protein